MSQVMILCPTDFSAHRAVALKHAVIYARATVAILVIVHVEKGVDPADGEAMLHRSVRRESAQTLRERLEAVLPKGNVACEHRLLRGKPAQGILRVAEAEDVGMIVMGTHGRTGLSRMLLGSVAEQVLREAKWAIVTIKASRE